MTLSHEFGLVRPCDCLDISLNGEGGGSPARAQLIHGFHPAKMPTKSDAPEMEAPARRNQWGAGMWRFGIAAIICLALAIWGAWEWFRARQRGQDIRWPRSGLIGGLVFAVVFLVLWLESQG